MHLAQLLNIRLQNYNYELYTRPFFLHLYNPQSNISSLDKSIAGMVLILDGNSEYVAHA